MSPRRFFTVLASPFLALAIVLSLIQFLASDLVVAETAVPQTTQGNITTTVIIDDFSAQPIMGDPFWYYSRIGSDRGEFGLGTVVWGSTSVTATVTQLDGIEGWVGVWTGLNHVLNEEIPLDLTAVFPSQIDASYQGEATAIRLHIIDGQGTLAVELQEDGTKVWDDEIALSGGNQTIAFGNLPDGNVHNLNWLVKGNIGDFVVVDRVEMDISLPNLPLPERAFLWSYAMLLSNLDVDSGIVRDRANFPEGDFDNVSASGLLAAATVQAEYLGMVSEPDASDIVTKITDGLTGLDDCSGLWPHFTKNGVISPDTEWSSVDTIIAQIALIEANQALQLNAGITKSENALNSILWTDVLSDNGQISHGFETNCVTQKNNVWNDFGGETWLANYGYAAATGNVTAVETRPPTHNGSGFIDEIAWLFVPAPYRDRWDMNWHDYRFTAVYSQTTYYENNDCYAPPGLFGLSAAEVPDPSIVSPGAIYIPFGIGGVISPDDGTAAMGHPVITPHYIGMAAPLVPEQAIAAWKWLEDEHLFSPLSNVESFMFIDEPTCSQIEWNSLRGSWNLGLQTLGWGSYLTGRNNPLYKAMWQNEMLRQAYQIMCSPTACHAIFLPIATR
ncbi:hypothetical protein [Candidatus Leptofilum sp.]|uniref:hypothetical protein n=1 Tax=Candidatus Leptofilum sp. TaxID=3241576 RepID=UPI003B5B0A47